MTITVTMTGAATTRATVADKPLLMLQPAAAGPLNHGAGGKDEGPDYCGPTPAGGMPHRFPGPM